MAGEGTEASMLYLPSPEVSVGCLSLFLEFIAAAGMPPCGIAIVMLLTIRPCFLDRADISWISIQLPVIVVLSHSEPVGCGRFRSWFEVSLWLLTTSLHWVIHCW